MDYIEQGKLSVAGVKFFVLDEADRLLDTGNQVHLYHGVHDSMASMVGLRRPQDHSHC